MRNLLEPWAQSLARFAIWSALVSFAWALRGPGGAVLAIGAGLVIQRGLRYGWWSLRPGAVKETYWSCLFASMGRVAKSGGRVTEGDIAAVDQVINALGLKDEQRELAVYAFNRGRDQRPELRRDFQRLRKLTARQPAAQADFLRLVVRTVLRGRPPRAVEREALLLIAALIAAPAALLEQCLSADSGGAPTVDIFAELGVSSDAAVPEIKRAYRGLMTRLHPDKLAASNLSAEERRSAEERVRRVRAAYDQIRRLRGFR